MVTCDDCRHPVERPPEDDTDIECVLCSPCSVLHNREATVRVRPLERDDLELLLAWRSNPRIYRHFRVQDDPINWNEHVTWYESRGDNRYDFVIQYDGRRVGVVSISVDDEVGIYLGDFSTHGHGIATVALEWLCERFEGRAPFTAEIHENNEPSKRLFERCGFEKRNKDSNWLQYIYEL